MDALSTPAQVLPSSQESRHTVPAGVLLPLVDLLPHWDVTPDSLLGPFGLSKQDVAEPFTRFTHDRYVAIIERARSLTGEPGLGVAWGLQMRISTFGFLGFATMSAATLRGAIELAQTFFELTSTAEPMRLQVEGASASLVLDEHADFGSVRDVALMGRFVGLWKIAEMITGRELRGTAEVAMPEPAYFARFANLLQPVRWSQPTTRMLFAAELLDYPLVMANPIALKLANDQCTRELQAMSSSGRILRSVRDLLMDPAGGFRSLPEVADAMGMSPRTLRRKLTAAGTSLSSLLDQERRDRALLLLRTSTLSLAEVAEQVGYANVQNFERAFQRWTGTTPARYRRD
jgi:AraC-like DNA-binding protein